MIEFLPDQDFSGTLISNLEDQGVGIDANHKFEMFSFEKIVSHRNEQQGLGIGLSTVKSLVEALAG